MPQLMPLPWVLYGGILCFFLFSKVMIFGELVTFGGKGFTLKSCSETWSW